jgi:response regulator RpfG family c-di-GMP phosphodiesterase
MTESWNNHILVVDDEPWIADIVAQQLEQQGFRADTSSDSTQVMDRIASGHHDLVVLDVKMPPPSGMELLGRIQRRYPHLPVLMLTASRDTRLAVRAMQEGATDFIVKPHEPALLLSSVQRAIDHGNTTRKRAQVHRLLEQRVQQQAQQLAVQSRQLAAMIERALLVDQAMLSALEAALDARDQSAPGHCRRVAGLAVRVGRRLGLDEKALVSLERGARLHDIGKLGIPDAILLKPGPLASEERQIVQRHPEIGYQIVSHIESLRDAVPIILYHHEHWDGSGYPHGLEGETIPLLARVFSVVDAFDAQSQARPYNAEPSVSKALASIQRLRGSWFDPCAVDALLALSGELDLPDQTDSIVDDSVEGLTAS